jgi:pantothenate synthetase
MRGDEESALVWFRREDFSEREMIEPPSVLVALAVRFGATRLIGNMIFAV